MSPTEEKILNSLLEALNKKDCPATKRQLINCFGLCSEEQNLIPEDAFPDVNLDTITSQEREQLIADYYETVPDYGPINLNIPIAAKMALEDLRPEIGEDTELEYHYEYTHSPKKFKKIQNLKKTLEKSLTALKDEDVKDFFNLQERHIQDDDREVESKLYQDTYFKLSWLLNRTQTFINKQKRTKGRPSYKGLRSFIFAVAELYEEITEAPFTFDLYVGDNKEYAFTTKSAVFVLAAIDWLYWFQETHTNYKATKFPSSAIGNICAEVRSDLLQCRQEKTQ